MSVALRYQILYILPLWEGAQIVIQIQAWCVRVKYLMFSYIVKGHVESAKLEHL